MKKRSWGILMVWMVIAVMAAGGTFLICRHLGIGTDATPDPGAQPDVDMQSDDAASGTIASAGAMQNFSDQDDGYAFSVPANWNIERTGSDTIALHPAASSPDASCKIEVSAFPFTSETDAADWIAHRIGADPSLIVAERSSEDVSVNGGGGVKWTGTIDNMPTTLVYLFSARHAYEIAPSVIGESADGDTQCDDMLETFLSKITI